MLGGNSHIPACNAFACFWQDVPKVNQHIPEQQRVVPAKYKLSIENMPAIILSLF